jgi:hypothetical protein
VTRSGLGLARVLRFSVLSHRGFTLAHPTHPLRWVVGLRFLKINVKVSVKITAPPAGRLREQGVGWPAVLWWVWGWGLSPVVVLSSPGTGGDQSPAGSASGGGFALV